MANCNYNNILLSFDEKSEKYSVTVDGTTWISEGRKPYIILRKSVGKSAFYTYHRLKSAKKKNTFVCDNKITTEYRCFKNFGTKTDFVLICTAEITAEAEVTFSVEAKGEKEGEIHSVYFPQPMNSKGYKKGYAVEPIRQGFIMPDGYSSNYTSTFALTKYWRKMNTGDWYHNFFGRVCDDKGYCAIAKTPYDAEGFSCFGKHKSFLTSVNWRSSLGKLSYKRELSFRFLDNCDYNKVAKSFREYLMKSKQFVSIDDKIKQNPNVAYLIGSPILHHRILTNIQPQSKFYKKGGKNQILCATFSERAKQLKKIKEAGLEKLYIHTDGWGVAGYDNKHPYILPPNEMAGGYQGLKVLADTAKEIGYCFGLHDQYRDYYYDSKKYDENLAVQKIDGSHPYCDIWDGGAHTWLCASKALPFVKETYETLKAQSIDIGGSYLDVFGVMWGDECFNPNHKITRQESIYHRGTCLDYLRENGIIASSEEGASLLMDKMDLVHHAPYQVRPQGGGKAVGIPVPLTGLVYHDCVFVPWVSSGVGGWGIPDSDSAKLHCVLHAGTPYFNPFGVTPEECGKDMRSSDKKLLDDIALKVQIKNAKELAEIQARLYNKEMLSHKFLDENYRKQQVTFSDGTEIFVDFDSNEYKIKWGK